MSSAEMIQTHPSQTASLGGTESTHHQHGTVDNEKFDMVKDNASSDVPDQKATTAVEDIHEIPAEGAKFHKLSWIRLTSVLIVEAIALGSLSMPASFATLGMVPAILITVGIGFVAIYSSLHIGNTWLKFPDLVTYPLAGGLVFERMFGPRAKNLGYWFTTGCFLLLLTFTTGSHSLTGKVAFETISNDALCGAGFAGISAIILFLLALPKTFSEMAILGYIDFASICAAIMITVIASGIEGHQSPGGLSAVEWHAFLPKDKQPTFAEAFLSVTNIVFAYAYAQCQFSFMAELRKPKDFNKSIWALGLTEIFIYTFTGATIYAFAGANVESPALLSTSTTVAKVAFGIALPVIFISGSINTTTAARFIYGKMYDGTRHQYISTPKGNAVWVALVFGITCIAYIIAEVIPIFSALLGLISALFISFFSFIFPPLFWIFILREGDWKKGKNLILTIVNAIICLGGFAVLVCGTYASAMDIKTQYAEGQVGSPFSCAAS